MKANEKKEANYSIHNVLKSTFYHKQEYHTCELQCCVLHVCCKKCLYFDIYQIFSLQTSQINQFWIFFFIFLERGCLYALTGLHEQKENQGIFKAFVYADSRLFVYTPL